MPALRDTPNRRMCAVLLVTAVCQGGVAAAAEVSFPLISYGTLGQQARPEDGRLFRDRLVLQAYFEQSLRWPLAWKLELMPFAGMKVEANDRTDEYWANALTGMPGLKLVVATGLPEGGWAMLGAGVRGEYRQYFGGFDQTYREEHLAGRSHDYRTQGFAEWSLGIDLARLLDLCREKPCPQSLVLFSWGLAAAGKGAPDEGGTVQGYFEQAAYWSVAGALAGPYAALDVKGSGLSQEYWNNRLSMQVGARVRTAGPSGKRLSSAITAFEVHWERAFYTTKSPQADGRLAVRHPDDLFIVLVGWWLCWG